MFNISALKSGDAHAFFCSYPEHVALVKGMPGLSSRHFPVLASHRTS
jgi:azurin